MFQELRGTAAGWLRVPAHSWRRGRLVSYLTVAGLCLSPSADAAPTYTTFDVPVAACGTYPTSVDEGAITGYYDNCHGSVQAFLRTGDGAITTFEAGTASLTNPVSIS